MNDRQQILERIDRLERVLNRRVSDIKREVRNVERTNYQQLTTYLELRRVFDSAETMPPLRGYAISPDLVFYLLDLLDRYSPKSIAEFGSGFSSVVFSRYADANNASVTSFDHEPFFAKKSAENVKKWGYEKSFELITTEVIEQSVDGQKVMFYDHKAAPAQRQYDFVFLDGPPQKLGLTVRGGLLPLFRPQLAPGCIIVLDDYYRPGEREIVKNWLESGYVELIEENEFIEKHAAVVRVV